MMNSVNQAANNELKEVIGFLERMFKPVDSTLDHYYGIDLETANLLPGSHQSTSYSFGIVEPELEIELETEQACGFDNEDEFEDGEVDVELERSVIQRFVGFDTDGDPALEIWMDTAFDPEAGGESLDEVRSQYPAETYRQVVITSDVLPVDVVDDPYFEEELLKSSAACISENNDLKEEIMQLKAEVAEHFQAIEEIQELLQSVLFSRNDTASKLDTLYKAIQAVNVEELTFAGIEEVIDNLVEGFEELPKLWIQDNKNLKAVATAIGLEGEFTNELDESLEEV